jgi:RNA polymerase-binding transcription factor DksA
MATAKKPASSASTAKKATAKAAPKAAAKPAPASVKKAPAGKATATKTAAAKATPATRTTATSNAKGATASSKKAPARAAAASKSAAGSSKASAAKAPAAKATATKSTAAKSTGAKSAATSTATKAAPAKNAAAPAPAKAAPAPKAKAVKGPGGLIRPSKEFDIKFLEAQQQLLLEERKALTGQAVRLESEANSLIEDVEMGDVQFDDESGEGDTMVVERERDLALSAQAYQTVADIDAALVRMADGEYGYSIVSGKPIPKERLKAIPWATVLVEEKVGGIGRR